MTGYVGEWLVRCHDCGAMVPSFKGLIDLPGSPEYMQVCFRPVYDTTMHNPSCTYCNDPETIEHLRGSEVRDREHQGRNRLAARSTGQGPRGLSSEFRTRRSPGGWR